MQSWLPPKVTGRMNLPVYDFILIPPLFASFSCPLSFALNSLFA